MFTRSELAFLGIAAVMHVGGLVVARTFPGTNLLSSRQVTPIEAVEIEIPDAPVIRSDRKEEADRHVDPLTPAAVAQQPTTERRRSDRSMPNATGGTGTGSPENAGSSDEPGPQVTGPGPSEEWSAPDEGGPPGTGGRPIYENPDLLALNTKGGEAAPTQAPKEKKADRDAANRLVKDLVRQNDKKLGLDLPAAGTVASVIRAAVQGSDAPGTARASFTVVLGPGGKVQSVKVGSTSAGNASTWEAVARQAKSALSAQKLNLTGDYVKGAVIVVNVQSKMTMPSGAAPDAGLKLSLEQSFDLSDIGAKPVRVVTASHSATPVN